MQMLMEHTLTKQVLAKWQMWLGALMIVMGALLITSHFVDLSQAPGQLLSIVEETTINLLSNSYVAASSVATGLETTNADLGSMIALSVPWSNGLGLDGGGDGGGDGMKPLPGNLPLFNGPGGAY